MADTRNRPGQDDAFDGLRRLNKDLRSGGAGGRRAGRGDGGGVGPNGRPLRRWPRRTLITANVIVALLLIGTAGTYGYVRWRLGQINHVKVLGLSITSGGGGGSTAPFTLLMVGSDTRNLGAGSSPAFGNTGNSGGGVAGQRSDSIMLVRVNPKNRALGLLSIPRDTLGNVPGYGFTRVNMAFSSGNPGLLVQVLKQDFDIQVNHYASFNFDTFRQVADAIGGVEQWFPAPARDLYSNLVVPKAGCVNLSGDQALAFVRSRHYQYFLNGSWHDQQSPESDLGRIERQQAFVRYAVHKAKRVAPTDPVALNGVIGGITKNLTLDNGFSDSLLLQLSKRFLGANLTNLPSWTYPTTNSQRVSGALDAVPDQGAQVVQQWLNVGVPASPPSTSTTKPASPSTTAVKPSSVSIEVQNGSGVSGQAGTAVSDLQKAGYQATVSSGSSYGHQTTVINYAPDSLAAAKQLQGQLSGGATLVEDSTLTASPYNLRLVTGQNFNGLGSGNSGSALPTTTIPPSNAPQSGPALVSPDSSSFYHGVYVPPGLSPGQTPQTCGE